MISSPSMSSLRDHLMRFRVAHGIGSAAFLSTSTSSCAWTEIENNFWTFRMSWCWRFRTGASKLLFRPFGHGCADTCRWRTPATGKSCRECMEQRCAQKRNKVSAKVSKGSIHTVLSSPRNIFALIKILGLWKEAGVFGLVVKLLATLMRFCSSSVVAVYSVMAFQWESSRR